MMNKSYSELMALPTYEERLSYLQCYSNIGVSTFGASRFLNQMLYNDDYWKYHVRNGIIIRDNGCDLGIPGLVLTSRDYPTVHHINPITEQQVLDRDPIVFDPENLILCSSDTHRLIHYSKSTHSDRQPIERKPFDTCPWKKAYR